MARAKQYWLFKSEPDVFSIDDLKDAEGGTTLWDGVRNYQARNLMRDEIKKGDAVLYYHSRIKPMGVAGVAKVVRDGYADPTQFDAKAKYYDAKATKDAPRWICVDIKFSRKFKSVVELAALKANPALEKMAVTQRGARLSVQPVTEAEFEEVLAMAKRA
jgi:predicted RNA-binding protein with PUA-like domain